MSDLPRAAVEAANERCMEDTWETTVIGILAAAVRDENGEPCPNLNCDDGVDLSTIDGLCGFCEGVGKVWVLKAGPAGHTDS